MNRIALPPGLTISVKARESNKGKKGEGNRKKAKSNGIVAVKALSNKIAGCSYYVMRDQVPYDAKHLFR
ncbi:MAG: hypothetical protein JRH06_16840 [Deltaproteobacteria bacterium]|nr:hypothetical protein [Deltaproteobacteria bacterium]MBW2139202.1 hypothetical protein [Deltaproteobacteria bacterium]